MQDILYLLTRSTGLLRLENKECSLRESYLEEGNLGPTAFIYTALHSTIFYNFGLESLVLQCVCVEG